MRGRNVNESLQKETLSTEKMKKKRKLRISMFSKNVEIGNEKLKKCKNKTGSLRWKKFETEKFEKEKKNKFFFERFLRANPNICRTVFCIFFPRASIGLRTTLIGYSSLTSQTGCSPMLSRKY